MIKATDAERRAALETGANLLRAVHPRQEATGQVRIGPNMLDVRAYCDADGVVRVSLRHTAELIAQSVPARFRSLDCIACPVAVGEYAADHFGDTFASLMAGLDTPELFDNKIKLLNRLADLGLHRQADKMKASELAWVLRSWAQQLEDMQA